MRTFLFIDYIICTFRSTVHFILTDQLIHHMEGIYSYRIAGHFRYLAPQSPQQKCSWVLIFVFQHQETTPTNSFACEISVHGSFIQVLIFALTALPSKNAICTSPHEHFPLFSITIIIITRR